MKRIDSLPRCPVLPLTSLMSHIKGAEIYGGLLASKASFILLEIIRRHLIAACNTFKLKCCFTSTLGNGNPGQPPRLLVLHKAPGLWLQPKIINIYNRCYNTGGFKYWQSSLRGHRMGDGKTDDTLPWMNDTHQGDKAGQGWQPPQRPVSAGSQESTASAKRPQHGPLIILLVPAPFLFSVHQHRIDLSLPLRQKPSLDSFRSILKTFLLPKLYPCHVFCSVHLYPFQVPGCLLPLCKRCIFSFV